MGSRTVGVYGHTVFEDCHSEAISNWSYSSKTCERDAAEQPTDQIWENASADFPTGPSRSYRKRATEGHAGL
jgi:hypothetical protein